MRTIYKYELDVHETPRKMLLPEGSIARHVAVVDHVIYIWIEQTTYDDVIRDDHTFTIYGTGHEFEYPEGSFEYVGTVFQGPFVWHIYHSW